jgi:hypothetical protein
MTAAGAGGVCSARSGVAAISPTWPHITGRHGLDRRVTGPMNRVHGPAPDIGSKQNTHP